MAILKGVEIWFAKVDPARPNAKFNKKNPTWEVQLRTADKAKKKEWEALNLPVKAVVPDEGEPYFRLNLRKKSIKADGEASSPVSILNGHLEAVDPNSIGNGSIGNARIYQYEYPKEGGGKSVRKHCLSFDFQRDLWLSEGGGPPGGHVCHSGFSSKP